MKALLLPSTAAGDEIGSDGEIEVLLVVEETDKGRNASVDQEIVGAGEGILEAAAAAAVVVVVAAALRRHLKAVVRLHLSLIGVLLRTTERKWIFLKQSRPKKAIVGKTLI